MFGVFKIIYYFTFLVLYAFGITSKIYFKEEFTDDDWQKRWIISQHPSKVWGKFVLTPGRYYGDSEISKGIQTSEDGKFYALTTKFEPFSNEDKVLVIQYSVKFEQDIKCGGAYIKLFDCNFDPKKFHSYKPYLIQFGPDICTFRKVHVIFVYKDRKLTMKRQLNCKDDHLTHLYTLVIKPDNSYLIKIDNKIERRGILEEDWDFLPPRKINNTKEAETQNQNQTDPEFYFIDKELKNNEQNQLKIENKTGGKKLKSTPTDIPNDKKQPTGLLPKNLYFTDFNFYKYDEICGVGFDLWQVESGTLFDNILITDDEFEAEKHGDDTWGVIREREKIMRAKFDKLTGKITESDHKHYHDEL